MKLRDSKRLVRNLLSTFISNTQTRQQQIEQVKGMSSALHVVMLWNILPEDAVAAKKLYW